MADAKHDPHGDDKTCRGSCPLKSESELEYLDRRAGHEYIPMDVYIDPNTIEEHFHAASIRNRSLKYRKTTP
jgi:hypothetical protein